MRAKLQDVIYALDLAEVALGLADEANSDSSYRVKDWPGPSKVRARSLKYLRNSIAVHRELFSQRSGNG